MDGVRGEGEACASGQGVSRGEGDGGGGYAVYGSWVTVRMVREKMVAN